VKVEGRGGMFGVETEATARSAVLSRSNRGPETMTRCHGWIFEFEGESWASLRALMIISFGMGVGRNCRVECLFWITSSSVGPLNGSDGSSEAIFC